MGSRCRNRRRRSRSRRGRPRRRSPRRAAPPPPPRRRRPRRHTAGGGGGADGTLWPGRAHRMFATPYSCYRVDATSKRQKLEVIALVAKLCSRLRPGGVLARAPAGHRVRRRRDAHRRQPAGVRRVPPHRGVRRGPPRGFSTHLVTARPRSSRRDVLELLERERIIVDSSNLWMMDDGEWERNDPRTAASTTRSKKYESSTARSSRALATASGTSAARTTRIRACATSKTRSACSSSIPDRAACAPRCPAASSGRPAASGGRGGRTAR